MTGEWSSTSGGWIKIGTQIKRMCICTLLRGGGEGMVMGGVDNLGTLNSVSKRCIGLKPN